MNWDGLLDGLTASVVDTFGESIAFQRVATGEIYEGIKAPFDPEYLPQKPNGATVEVISRIPVFDVRVADIGGVEPASEDLITRLKTGVVYRVIRAQASSSGMIKCEVRKQ